MALLAYLVESGLRYVGVLSRLLFVNLFVTLFFAIHICATNLLADESSKSEESKLVEMLQIFYVNDKMKSPYDQIEIKGSEAFVQVWRDLPLNPVKEKVECLGYQWLLSGRGEKMGVGALEVFKSFPNLKALNLDLVEVENGVKSVNQRGQLAQQATIKRYLHYRIERDEIQKFSVDQDNLKKNLRKDQASCLKIGRRLNMQKELNL